MEDYKEELRKRIWNRLRIVKGKNPEFFRLDAAGALIEWDQYGEHTPNGWQVDHACPKKLLEENGIKEDYWDYIEDLRPFNTANNELKSNDFPKYIRAVYYDEHLDRNVKDGVSYYIVNRQVQKAVQKHFQLPIKLFGDGHVSSASAIMNYLGMQ